MMRQGFARIGTACVLILLAGGLPRPAPAQGLPPEALAIRPNLPATVIPPGGTPVPELAPRPGTRVLPGLDATRPAAPTPGVEGQVGVRSLRVEGATAFSPDQLAAATAMVQPGPAVPLADIEAARTALINLYRGAGYPFSAVDAVLEADGTLRFAVSEGHIVEVRLDGDIGPAGTQVLRFLDRLTRVRPIDVGTLERYLLLAQQVPGVTLRTVLRPAGTEPGALTLVAQVSRKAIDAFITADNRGFRLTGPAEALASASFNSFTEFGERTDLSLFFSSGGTGLFGQASTEFFLGGSGLRLRAYAGRGNSWPSGQLAAIGYTGETTLAGAQLSYPVILRRQQSLVLSAIFDAIETEIRVDDLFGLAGRLSQDSLRIMRLGADWSLYDLLAGEDRPAVNSASLRISQGVTALGASRSGSAEFSRFGADPGFTKLTMDVTRVQALFAPWAGALLSLQTTLAGQWSNDVLPQAEKYYLGGARLGRGYYAGQLTGDSAFAASVELQLAMPWEAALLGRSVAVNPMVYAFYDYGRVWQNTPEEANQWLASLGLGLRASLTRHAEFQVEGVHRIARRLNGTLGPELKGEAVFWRVLLRY
jgi:hemolysin activation/secretion protein